MAIDGLLQLVILVGLFTVATPVAQLRRFNETSHPPIHSCSLLEYAATAQCYETISYRLWCKGGLPSKWLSGKHHVITHLTVFEWPGQCFDIGRLTHHFPALRHLAFINCSALTIFQGNLFEANVIEKFVMHGLRSLWEVPTEVVLQMPQLREMDLRNNVLRHVRSSALKGPPRLERVYLAGNKWDCSDNGLDWLAMENNNGTIKGSLIVDYYRLTCNQQLYRGKPLHKVMDIIQTTLQTCPAPCECKMTNVVSDASGAIIPLITVDCAQKQLAEPPATLPPSTTTLRLEGNKISTISMIIQNPHYKRIVDLYLDNNSLSTVKELEAAEWFSSFRVLSLRGNMLKQIPVYAFDKAIQGNNNIMHVFLGHNPWRCDCHFIPRFQTLLFKFKRVIRDQADIRCSRSSEKKLSLAQIIKLPLGNVCSSDVDMPISTINIVNLVLLALIIMVLSKFLYDRHNFKATGKLPWISSVLPKWIR